MLWGGGKAYFFKGKQYLRYDVVADHVDPGYPRPIAGNWPGMWPEKIDAAICWPGNGTAYFSKGDQYPRYDIAGDKTDAGYPKPIAGNWPGFPADFAAGVQALEVGHIGELALVGAAQLHLHVGIDHARRERDNLGAVRLERFFERHAAGVGVHARLGGAVSGLRGHGAAAQARRYVQHFFRDGPAFGAGQENAGQRHRRFQAHAQRVAQIGRGHGRQRRDLRNHTGVVDQRDAGPIACILRGEPGAQTLGGRVGIGQVLFPLCELIGRLSGCRQFAGGAAGNAQQSMALGQELLAHGQAHAARAAGEDGEVFGGHNRLS